MNRTRWLTGIFTAVMLLWANPADAQSCNSCEPCGLDGIKTCDLCITPWSIMYLAQPTCMSYPPGCGNLIECQEGLALTELISNPDWAEIGEFEQSHPGTFEYYAKRDVLIVREPCGRQIIAVLEVPDEQRRLVAALSIEGHGPSGALEERPN